MRTRIPTLAPRARQRGIGFLVVVLVLGLATITAGAGVTVYKISQGQTPSLEIQMGIKEGKIKLKVDPELGASLASNALTAGQMAAGTYSGGMTFNRFVVVANGDTAPAGYEAVTDNADAGIRVVSDPGLGSTARIDLSQTLEYSVDVTDATLPFAASGGMGFVTNIAAPDGSSSHVASAVWTGDVGGLSFAGHDALFGYTASGLHLGGSGTVALASKVLTAGQALEWGITGEQAAQTASLVVSAVPEPGSVALMAAALGLVLWRARRRCVTDR
ncbi:MAG: PEP-CTERM sorting domain-containing protein [Burkholderiales bacterium]